MDECSTFHTLGIDFLIAESTFPVESIVIGEECVETWETVDVATFVGATHFGSVETDWTHDVLSGVEIYLDYRFPLTVDIVKVVIRLETLFVEPDLRICMDIFFI